MLLKIKVYEGYVYILPEEVTRVEVKNMGCSTETSGRIDIYLKDEGHIVSIFDDAHETFENIKDFLTNYVEDSDKHQLSKNS